MINTPKPSGKPGEAHATPNERYQATRKAVPRGADNMRNTQRKVWDTGNIRYSRWVINLGRAHAGTQVQVNDDGAKIRINDPDGTHLTSFSADTPKGYVPR